MASIAKAPNVAADAVFAYKTVAAAATTTVCGFVVQFHSEHGLGRSEWAVTGTKSR